MEMERGGEREGEREREIVCPIWQYGSLDDVMNDVELLVSNATTFNEEDSTVYQVSERERCVVPPDTAPLVVCGVCRMHWYCRGWPEMPPPSSDLPGHTPLNQR